MNLKSSYSYILLLLFLLISIKGFSQVNVDYPMDRIVIQRDNNNRATIQINGRYTRPVDRVEARLEPINGGSPTDWQVIQLNPQGGFFSGKLEASGGWYRLEVKCKLGNNDVGSANIEHVGIGEVFIIAGQSNAQGFHGFGAPSAGDDRVSCVNQNNQDQVEKNSLDYPTFSHLNSNSNIAPRGESAWAWGRLGDRLVEKLGVPVLFYNAAFEGTLVRSWREGITGTAYSPYVPYPYPPSGMPFINLRWVLQYYVPITGVRAVLWEQGEADNLFSTNKDQYTSDLKSVISASRNESGKNLSWVISISTYDNTRGVNNSIRASQKGVIASTVNVFEGPDTDNIQIPRSNTVNRGDGVHFTGDGLVQLGNAWNERLNDNFFINSKPQSSQGFLKVDVSCAGNNAVRLAAEVVGYNSFSWSNGQNGDNITVGNGSYRVSARDAHGNILFSPLINIDQRIILDKPSISLEGSNPVCLGNTATLISSFSENIGWNTGSTDQRLLVTSTGDYRVSSKSIYGCQNNSDPYSITVVNSPLPPKPTVTASSVTTFCDGGEVTLQSQVVGQPRWSNGASTGSIIVKSSGDYTVRAIDNVGCYSPVSDIVKVIANPNPAKPQINFSGSTIFCEGEKLVMTSNYDAGNIWSTGSNNKSIEVNNSGNFTVFQRDKNGCSSETENVTTKVNKLPASPSVTALRPTTFCDGENTLLQSSSAANYIWSNGASNPEVIIYESGNYTVSAKDANGCISLPSLITKVTKNSRPVRPTLVAQGPTTFCENLNVEVQSSMAKGYLWSNGQSTQSIKINTAGLFSVQTFNEFLCYSEPSNSIVTNILSIPSAPVVEALGATTFCDGGKIILKANGSNLYWSNGINSNEIVVNESGNYFAQNMDAKGCFSNNSNAIIISVKPKPAIPVIQQVGVYTLIASNNSSEGDFIWTGNGTILNNKEKSIKTVNSGKYVVKNSIEYANGLTCLSENSEVYQFEIDKDASQMVVFPNPVSNSNITVETFEDLSNAVIQIIDLKGVIYKSLTVDVFNSQQSISLDGLVNGTYFVRIVSNGLKQSKKIVVLH